MSNGLEAGIKKYTEQLAQDPKSRVFVPLADAYRQLGRCEEAIAVAQEGLKHHPTYVSGKIALARAYFENGDADPAQELLQNVLLTSPDNLLANRIFAEISIAKGNADAAVRALENVLRLEPSDHRATELLKSVRARSVPAEAPPAPKAETPPVQAAAAGSPPPVLPPEEKIPTGPPLRTATLAELYRSQGHLKESLAVYEELEATDSANPLYAGKIREITAALKPPAPDPEPPRRVDRAALLNTWLSRIAERRRTV